MPDARLFAKFDLGYFDNPKIADFVEDHPRVIFLHRGLTTTTIKESMMDKNQSIPIPVDDWNYSRSLRRRNPQGAFVYLVAWPHIGVLKAGFAGNLRERTARYICKRNGRVVRAWWFPTQGAAIFAEQRADGVLRSAWRPAFSTALDAVPYVGGRGSGWSECYKVPTVDFARAVNAVEVSIDG